MSPLNRHLVALLATVLAVVLGASRAAAQGCDSCAAPAGALADPTGTCQIQSGSTDAACPSDFYTVNLEAGERYVFTLCDTTCTGATGDYDTRLILYDPACVEVDNVDDSCGLLSEITYDSTLAGTYVVEVTGFTPSNVGNYTLGWMRVCFDGDCSAPDGALATPITDCQLLPDTLECGDVLAYSVALDAGQQYWFTFCGSTCPGADAPFDSRLELWGPEGLLRASATNNCGDDAEIAYDTDTASGAGTYCVRVMREAGAASDFTLGWYVTCQGPSGTNVRPSVGAAIDPGGCVKEQTFTATTFGTGLFTWTWTVVPPPGASASPSTFTETTAARQSRMVTTLTGLGDYDVSVTVTNACGTDVASTTYTLSDRRGPDLTCLAEPTACRTLRAVSRAPGLPPAPAAVTCGAPCTVGTLEADNPFYEVFVDCGGGSYTARTGDLHSVTTSSGSKQNVIFAGASGSPGTSDMALRVHDVGVTYQDPPGGSSCVFDPPDTPAEPGSIGLETEWTVSPMSGVTLVLRQEVVAFGDTEENSGVRLTLGATNLPGSTSSVNMGVRWQIDYQNSFDDGPLYAPVICEPFSVGAERSTEHELLPGEITDFYRIQNNESPPIFANFTSTTGISGFPDTGTPDRLVYASWPSSVSTAWDRVTNEGDTNPDFDSCVIYYYGYDPADGIVIGPGDSFTRSVVIFTAGESVDCNGFVPGNAGDAEVTICPDQCARIGAEATDNCSTAVVVLEETSPGAPPCVGNPCIVQFPAAGDYTYTWSAEDEVGNRTICTSRVRVMDTGACNTPPSCEGAGPYASTCRDSAIDGATAEDVDGDPVTWTWTSDRADVTVAPGSGTLPGSTGAQGLPPAVASLDPSVPPCGVTATLTLTVDDGRGGVSTCSTTVTFSDVEAPALVGAPADETVECDAVPGPPSVGALDACDAAPSVTFAETRVDGDCPGRYTLVRTWTAMDACLNAASSSQTLAVVDTTPPVVGESSAVVACTWPPNHRYVCFDASSFAPLVTENCSEPVTWRFSGCGSSQPDDAPDPGSTYNGDGHTTDDCVVSADGQSFCVRSERDGGGPDAQDGRRYGVTVVAVDACGNESASVLVGLIHVPHDQSPHEKDCVNAAHEGLRGLD
jgi:hypothetical protein